MAAQATAGGASASVPAVPGFVRSVDKDIIIIIIDIDIIC